MRALLSVYDKSSIVELARELLGLGFELVSTGGTHRTLTEAGIPATAVSEVTGFPEILDGRVKTLHPAVHGALLARRDVEDHLQQLNDQGIAPIDLVAINLYPFESTVAQANVSFDDAIEQIDIGGPAMLRAAAKNHESVLVLCDPADYSAALDELRSSQRDQSLRRQLAATAFQHVSTYDSLVARYLRGVNAPMAAELTIPGRKAASLRYGENPHQAAAAYTRLEPGMAPTGVLTAHQLGGIELSYNNLLDADAAVRCLRGFTEPACAVIKHTIPCGAAIRSSIGEAVEAAIRCDPVSAFGGIVTVNRPIDDRAADALLSLFLEVVVAPGFESDALARLKGKKQLRLLELPDQSDSSNRPELEVRSIAGGLLVQEADVIATDTESWQFTTGTDVPTEVTTDLHFAWELVRRVKSNAIVIARDQALCGLGSGQPNRVDAVRQAIDRAGGRAVRAVLASDAFFPFADSIELAAAAGVSAIVQPGGSVRDPEVIDAARAAGIAMIFTGRRHFLH